MPIETSRVITTVLVITCSPAFAMPNCFHKDLSNYGKLTRKIAEYADSPTHRETTEEYAKSHGKTPEDIENSVAATGRLKCGNRILSANLVIKGDVILTANHTFIDPKTCQTGARPTDCTFQAKGNPPIAIAGMISSGNKCPQLDVHDADWAILKLSRPVTDVRPYGLKERNAREGISAQPVVAVGDHSVDFHKVDPKSRKKTYPKHLQDCEIRRVFYRYDPVAVASNCDGSAGKSGGALLQPGLDNPIIVGLTVGASFSEAEKRREIRTGVPTRKNFDKDTWYDSGFAIDGRLRDELEKATK